MLQLFKPTSFPSRVSTGLLILRVVAGAAFMFHGYGKMQSPFGWMGEGSSVPGAIQFLAMLAEFGGGLAWILGLLTPLASLGILFTMATAVFMHIAVYHDPFIAIKGGSYEMASIYFCVALLLLLAGPGRFSLDRLFFGTSFGEKHEIRDSIN